MVETTEARWQRYVENGRRFVSQGDYAQAEQSLLAAVKEALSLGPADLRVASSLGILGKLKHRQGERDRAQALLERALAVREEALGREHYGVVQGLNDLASLHYAYGQLDEARALFERSLSIAEKRLAPDHGDLALALYNLSRVYFKSGDHLRAEPLLSRLLDLKQRTLGEEHTDVAAILTALARVRSMAGRHDEAEEMARRALAIREKELPADDPAIAISLELVAYFCAGRARRMRSLADAERILRGGRGDSHDGTPDSAAGDATLDSQLELLADEERALRERARDVRSRSGVRREPTTLERSPEPLVAPAVEASSATPPTPVVKLVETEQKAHAPEISATSNDAAVVAPTDAAIAVDPQDSWRLWQGPASLHAWQESERHADAHGVHAATEASETVTPEPSQAVVGAAPAEAEPEESAEPRAPDASDTLHSATMSDELHATTMCDVQPPVIIAEVEYPEPVRDFGRSVTYDEPRSASFAPTPSAFVHGRRGRWIVGIAALALIAAGAAGFAMGRGVRVPGAEPIATLQESSRGVIEESRVGSQQSPARGVESHPTAAMPPTVHEVAPTRRPRSGTRAERSARVPSQLQARRMTRTMERLGSKVMSGVEARTDSIGRSLELPPPKFDKP